MTAATRNEIEYLSSVDVLSAEDPALISEMAERLDALRRFDQDFSFNDWRSEAANTGWRSTSSLLAR